MHLILLITGMIVSILGTAAERPMDYPTCKARGGTPEYCRQFLSSEARGAVERKERTMKKSAELYSPISKGETQAR